MFFLDNNHEEAFRNLILLKGKGKDLEYASAYYVLMADNELRKKGMRHITEDGIDWESIWDNDWSNGYRVLLQLAESLFKSAGSVEMVYGLGIWGEELYRIAM